ncbi:VOC family protein [Paenibacillus koleovorans]|uniref:VOC family protein n=1 Tax=Paenibacillus koleovorans TaxID=121608 RepID=UPI000FDCCC13|nr:VOC family protein [Paenibacillus koleovorans]
MIQSIHHVSFTIKEMDRSIAFYRHLGFQVASDRRQLTADYLKDITGYAEAEMHVAYLNGFNVQLELIQYVAPAGIDLDKTNYHVGSAHICFITDDIHAEYERLKQAGVRFRTAPIAIREGPNAGKGAVYFYDPDGYTLELAAVWKQSDSSKTEKGDGHG